VGLDQRLLPPRGVRVLPQQHDFVGGTRCEAIAQPGSPAWRSRRAAAGGDPSSQSTGTIAIHNGSTHAFGRVYAEPSPATVFSTQRNAIPLEPGLTIAVSGLEAGAWDCLVIVYDQGTRFLAAADAVPVDAGETVPLTFSDADFYARFEVTNAGTFDITGLALGSSGAWGSNLLDPATPIAPGTALIPPIHFSPGAIDLRCDFADGSSSSGPILLEPLVLTRVTCPFP